MKHLATAIVLSAALAAPVTAVAGGCIGLGVGQASVEIVNTLCDDVTAVRVPGAVAESGTEALHALGVDFHATDRVSIRLQYERIDLESAIDVASLALVGRF